MISSEALRKFAAYIAVGNKLSFVVLARLQSQMCQRSVLQGCLRPRGPAQHAQPALTWEPTLSTCLRVGVSVPRLEVEDEGTGWGESTTGEE